MKKNIYNLVFLLLLFVNFGCDSRVKSFSNTQISDATKIYFYYNSEDFLAELDSTSLLSKEGFFYIEDELVINEIVHNWRFKRNSKRKLLRTFYKISLTSGNEIIWDGILNIDERQLILHNGDFEFEVDSLMKYRPYFLKTEGNLVICKNIKECRVIYHELLKHNVFIPIQKMNGINPLFVFNGKMILQYKPLTKNESLPEVRIKIINELEVDNLASVISIDYKKEGLYLIEIACREDITNTISSSYEVIESFSDLLEINLPVYGLQLKDIERIISELEITNFEVKPM